MDYFYQQIGMFESVIWHIFSHSFYNEFESVVENKV